MSQPLVRVELLIPGLLGRCLKDQMLVEALVELYWWQAPQRVSPELVWLAVKRSPLKLPVTE